MKCFLLEKVPFKLPGKGGRLIWGVVVSRSQSDGTSLLYIKKPDNNWEDTLVAAVENPQKRYYEAAARFAFPLGKGDLVDVGAKLKALGDEESEAEMMRLFDPEDLF